MSERGQAAGTRLPFYLLLAWLIALPWPLGANRDWIWPWYAAVLFAIAALAAWRGVWLQRCRVAHVGLRVALCCGAAIVAIDLIRALIAQPANVPIAKSIFALADPDVGRLSVLKGVSMLLLAILLIELTSSRRRARRLLACVFLVGVAQALLALGLALGAGTIEVFGHRLGAHGFTSGTFINRNHFAGMLELAGAAGLGLLASGLHARHPADRWRERLRRFVAALLSRRLLVRIGLAVLVVALVMTRSRMGNAAFFVGLTAAGVAALIWWRPLPRIFIWLLLSIVAVDVLVLGAWVGVDKLAERLVETQLTAPIGGNSGAWPDSQSVEPTEAERWTVASSSLRLWRQRPWLGHGAGSFRVVFPSVKPASVWLFYENAHNDYVQLLVERGIVGMLLMMAALFGLLLAAQRALKHRHDSLARGLALASIAAMVAFAVHSLVDFNLQIPANQYVFLVCALLGALALQLPEPRREQRALADGLQLESR